MPALPEFNSLLSRQEGPILTITLNRPDKLNAFNGEMFTGLTELAEIASKAPDIRVVVFTGAGRAFSSGADLSSLNRGQTQTGGESSGESFTAGIKMAQGVFDRIEAIPKPTIAAINGHAIGAGLQLALACDFRIVAKWTKLGLPDVKNGIIPALGATTRLPRLIGLAKAKELILTGDLITPEQALEIGLVNSVVQQEALVPAVNTLAKKLISRAPIAQAAAKTLLNTKASLDRVAETQARLIKTADAREGISAFLEKRDPKFKGA